MFLRTLVALAMLFLAPLALCAAEPDKPEKKTDTKAEENPYKKAEKGQWATYKMAMKFAGNNIDGTMKQTVVEKDDKSITLEVVMNILGQEQKQTQKIEEAGHRVDQLQGRRQRQRHEHRRRREGLAGQGAPDGRGGEDGDEDEAHGPRDGDGDEHGEARQGLSRGPPGEPRPSGRGCACR